MVKPSSSIQKEARVTDSNEAPKKYKGVRKRAWGKYVSEIRLPNSRERIWLGSYSTAEKAARAFDAALYCLRGSGSKFNFPESPPLIENGRSMTPPEIQAAAARFARASEDETALDSSGRVGNVDSCSEEASSDHVMSPSCASVSGGLRREIPEVPLLDEFFYERVFTDNNGTDLGLFPEFNEYTGDYTMVPPDTYCQENNYYCDELHTYTEPFLWNF